VHANSLGAHSRRARACAPATDCIRAAGSPAASLSAGRSRPSISWFGIGWRAGWLGSGRRQSGHCRHSVAPVGCSYYLPSGAESPSHEPALARICHRQAGLGCLEASLASPYWARPPAKHLMVDSICRWRGTMPPQVTACGVLSADQGGGGGKLPFSSQVGVCQLQCQRFVAGADLVLRPLCRTSHAWPTSGPLTMNRCHAADMLGPP